VTNQTIRGPFKRKVFTDSWWKKGEQPWIYASAISKNEGGMSWRTWEGPLQSREDEAKRKGGKGSSETFAWAPKSGM